MAGQGHGADTRGFRVRVGLLIPAAMGLAVAGFPILMPLPAAAQVIDVGPGETEIWTGANSGGAIHSGGTLHNFGSNDNTGTLDNSGTLNNNLGGIIDNGPAATINNGFGGILNNFGTLNNVLGSTINNAGVLTNTGILINDHLLINTGILDTTAGTFINNDTVHIGDGGTSGTLLGDVENSHAVIFNRLDATSYDGVISGSGFVVKEGDGTLTLSGEHTYTGRTTVDAGELVVDGSIVGNVEVLNGATLGGIGSLGAVEVESGGTFAPGNSIGSNTAAALILHSGSIFEVEINDGGFVAGVNNDHTEVTGSAAIGEVVIAIRSFPAGDDGSTYTPGRYTILNAGSLSVLGDLILDEDFAYLDFAYDFNTTSLWLDSTLSVSSFCLAGQSNNQCATGDGAFSLGAGNSVFSNLLTMTEAEAAAALNGLSGEVHASAQGVFVENASFIRDAALTRVRTAFDEYGGNDTAILSYAPGAKIGPAQDRYTLWAHAFGGMAETDGDGNAADLDSHEYGFVAGTDGFVADDWRLGVLAGYSHTEFEVNDRASSGEADNAHLGIYGGTEWGPLGLRFGLANSWHFVTTDRAALGDALEADYDARTLQAFGELGYRLDSRNAWFEPYLNAAWVGHHSDGFSESGGIAALEVEDSDSDTGFTTLGLRGATDFMLGHVPATARGALGWRHAFGDVVPDSVHAFAGGTAFTVSGTPIAEDAAVIEAGLDLAITETASFGLSYAGQFAEDAHTQSGRARISVRF